MEPPKLASTASIAPRAPVTLHDTILLDILLLLPTAALLRARAVSRHWLALILGRRHLRSRCFQQPPTAPPLHDLAAWTLHPALRLVDYWGYRLPADEEETARPQPPQPLSDRARLGTRRLEGSPVATAMASMPAVPRVGVWVAGTTRWVECPDGVSVWALLEGFDALIQEKRKPDEGRRFLWDHKIYPLAGFRILPSLCDVSGSGSIVVVPEFFDAQAIVAELRNGSWAKESSRVPFCFELPE